MRRLLSLLAVVLLVPVASAHASGISVYINSSTLPGTDVNINSAPGVGTGDVPAPGVSGSTGANVNAAPLDGTGDILNPIANGSGLPCDSTINAGNLASALSSAAAGSTICMNAGSYSWSGTPSKTVMTTAKPAPGVSRSQVTMGADMLVGTRNVKIQGVTWSNGGATIHQGSTASNIILDSGDWPNIPKGGCGSCLEGRLSINGGGVGGPDGYHGSGIVISNNFFHGPTSGSNCSDMIQISGGAWGNDVIGNEFVDLGEQFCGAIHGDPMQFYGGEYTFISRNWFHGNQDEGILSWDCNGSPMTVTHNVFQNTNSALSIVDGGGAPGDTFSHNVFRNGSIAFGASNNCSSSGLNSVTVTNNVMTRNAFLYDPNDSFGGTIDYNLVPSGAAGSHSVNGSPTFTGGSSPSSWDGFALASGSLGYHAGNDGLSMGVVP